MCLPVAFRAWLEPFLAVMTQPTFESFLLVLSGWVLAQRHTLTGALQHHGLPVGPKHFSAYHRVFSTARWDLDAIGLRLADGLLRLIPSGPVYVVIDDTLCRKCGWKIFGASPHFDPLLSSRKQSNANRHGYASGTIKSRGHCWVVLGLALTFAFWPAHVFCLPVLFRLYLTTPTAAKVRCRYYPKPELARQMLLALTARHPERTFHLLIDSAYAGQDMLKARPPNCQITAAWFQRAALYAPVPPAPAKQRGRPLRRGPRLPGIAAMLAQPCPRLNMDCYGLHHALRVASQQACFYATPEVVLQVLATEPLSAGGHPQPQRRAVFYSTCIHWTPEAILQAYARRWSIEATFRAAKQDLGLAQPQAWSPQAVRRTAPVLLLLYSLVVVWFAHSGQRRWRPTRWPWYPAKANPSFADMLATLRQEMLRHRFRRLFQNPLLPPVLQKPLRRLFTLWKLTP